MFRLNEQELLTNFALGHQLKIYDLLTDIQLSRLPKEKIKLYQKVKKLILGFDIHPLVYEIVLMQCPVLSHARILAVKPVDAPHLLRDRPDFKKYLLKRLIEEFDRHYRGDETYCPNLIEKKGNLLRGIFE